MNNGYRYFLKCENSFTDHVRNNEYNKEEFHSKYPMASLNYAACNKHTYSKVVTKQATCKETGIITYTCAHGDSVYTEVIPKDNTHHYDKGVVTKKATVSENGVITYTCVKCKNKKTQKIVSPKKVTLSKTTFVYNGKVQRPTVKVVDVDGKIISSSYYDVNYSKNSKDAGNYSVKVAFKGKYSGTLQSSYRILPRTTKLTSVTNTKAKTITVKWSKVNGIDGYQIQYSTDQKFKSKVKTVKVSKANKTSQSIKSVKKGRTYYVRIRTYKTNNKKTVYSVWSTSSKIKVSK